MNLQGWMLRLGGGETAYAVLFSNEKYVLVASDNNTVTPWTWPQIAEWNGQVCKPDSENNREQEPADDEAEADQPEQG